MMAKPIKADDGSDSEDLQALFDSIAAAGPPPAPPPPPARPDSAGDSDDLQALFDSVAQAQPAGPAASPVSGHPDDSPHEEVVFNRLGHLARQLHDSLRGLGVDKMLADTANQIPDARQRLTYIAQMTEQAASKVLNAADIAKPIQDELIGRSEAMSKRWDRMFANQLSVDEFKMLATDTRAYFSEAPSRLKITNDQLMEIMMAQDFQDLTGQVIKKVVDVVQNMETQLLSLLIEAMPEQRKAEAPEGLLNGPVISSAGRSDVVTSQTQVDDLLESLGF
ncbi:MAG: protein phosphatase CheZ [Sulfuritalea sp.]|jgi:chemotaxis protein CheZ|nr:protein phosphatase CheZ [Sulfuritalea sp.]